MAEETAPPKPGVFRRISSGIRAALTPIPEEKPEAVPPIVEHRPAIAKAHSPFSMGFFGAMGVLVAIGLAQAVLAVQNVIVLVIMALFLALGLSPAVDVLTRRRVPRSIAVLFIAGGVLSVVVLGVVAVVPILTEQATMLVNNLPQILNNIASQPQLTDWNQRYDVVSKIEAFIASGALLNNLFGGIMGAGQVVANALFSFIMIVVLTTYFLASLPTIKDTIYSLAPASRRPRTKYLAEQIFGSISGYLTGMFVVVSVASVCAFIFMNIVGLSKYSLALSFLVAMLCFIPVAGSFLAMAAVAIVAFGTSPALGLATIIYFLIYTQFDAYVVYPNVMKRHVKVPGALVVLSAIIGGILMGIIGVVIAIPTTAALLLLYREVLRPALDAA